MFRVDIYIAVKSSSNSKHWENTDSYARAQRSPERLEKSKIPVR